MAPLCVCVCWLLRTCCASSRRSERRQQSLVRVCSQCRHQALRSQLLVWGLVLTAFGELGLASDGWIRRDKQPGPEKTGNENERRGECDCENDGRRPGRSNARSCSDWSGSATTMVTGEQRMVGRDRDKILEARKVLFRALAGELEAGRGLRAGAAGWVLARRGQP